MGVKKTIGGSPIVGADGKQTRDITGKPATTGGREFEFFMMPASIATEVEIVVVGVIPEAVVKLISAQGADKEKQAEAMAGAVGTLAASLGKLGTGKATELMNTLFQYVRVEGENGEGERPVNLDLDFTGRPKMKWTVAFEALRVNFADFFPEGFGASLSLPSVNQK